jgi:hypothetical protein
MGIIDSYVKLVEQTYSLKVVNWNYDHDDGWNPMVIRFQDDQLKLFLKNYGGNGGRNGVKYLVTLNGDVKFISLAGQLIEDLLETVTGKRRNRE